LEDFRAETVADLSHAEPDSGKDGDLGAVKTIMTHKIDPDGDETRDFLIQNLWYSQGLEKFAFVKGVGAAPISAPRRNLTGDPCFTDGLRTVLWISNDPVDFEEVEFVEWEFPSDP
jgi:hypothetical protein